MPFTTRFRMPSALAFSVMSLACNSETVGGGQDTPNLSGGGGSNSGGGVTSGGAATGCEQAAPNPGRSPLRRLNRIEYISTVADLLSLTNAEELAGALPPDEQGAGFSNNADALVVTGLLAGNYIDIADKLAAEAVKDVSKLTACTAGEDPAVCAARFVDSFGKRAFRRPLSAAEHTTYLAFFDQGAAGRTFADGISMVLRGFLQSPHFLYRVEAGQPPAPGASATLLTPYELATRLSYALWGTMPDDALFAAADQGMLASASTIEQTVRQLLTDARAKRTVAGFHGEWLSIGGVTTVGKDPQAFPSFTADLQNDLRTELNTFVNEVFWQDGKVASLLAAPYTYVNANLASFYGLPPPTGDGFVKVPTNPQQHVGFLTSGALMAFLAHNDQTSPVHRGKFVRERILCQTLPDPPGNIVIKVPVLDPNTSTRERFHQHSADAKCAGCHRLMDPLGLTFEHYDPIGKWRDKDGPADVDATGHLGGTSDADGDVNGAAELAQKLSTSNDARECVMKQVFRYTAGRSETIDDACTLAAIKTKFASTDYDMRELWVAVATSDAFRYRSLKGGGE